MHSLSCNHCLKLTCTLTLFHTLSIHMQTLSHEYGITNSPTHSLAPTQNITLTHTVTCRPGFHSHSLTFPHTQLLIPSTHIHYRHMLAHSMHKYTWYRNRSWSRSGLHSQTSFALVGCRWSIQIQLLGVCFDREWLVGCHSLTPSHTHSLTLTSPLSYSLHTFIIHKKTHLYTNIHPHPWWLPAVICLSWSCSRWWGWRQHWCVGVIVSIRDQLLDDCQYEWNCLYPFHLWHLTCCLWWLKMT